MVIGKIRVMIQWIVSRVEFFNNIIDKIDKQIIESQDEFDFYTTKLDILESNLNIFIEPFGFQNNTNMNAEPITRTHIAEEFRPRNKPKAEESQIQIQDQFKGLEMKTKETVNLLVPKMVTALGLSN